MNGSIDGSAFPLLFSPFYPQQHPSEFSNLEGTQERNPATQHAFSSRFANPQWSTIPLHFGGGWFNENHCKGKEGPNKAKNARPHKKGPITECGEGIHPPHTPILAGHELANQVILKDPGGGEVQQAVK